MRGLTPPKQALACLCASERLRTSPGEVLGKSSGSPEPVCSTITPPLGAPQDFRTPRRGGDMRPVAWGGRPGRAVELVLADSLQAVGVGPRDGAVDRLIQHLRQARRIERV